MSEQKQQKVSLKRNILSFITVQEIISKEYIFPKDILVEIKKIKHIGTTI